MRFILVLFLGITLQATTTFALPSDDAVNDAEREEYDFSWLDPEKKIYVVQNRKYKKSGHFELGGGVGVGIGETYRTQRQWNLRGTMFLSEHWGFTGFLMNNINSENDDFVSLKRNNGTVPVVRDTNKYYGASVMWLPFYGKMNMFNQIFYLDWHFEAGLGSADTEIDLNRISSGSPLIQTASYMSFHFGTGWKFFITRHWGARLDFLSTFYRAPNGLNGVVVGSAEQTYDNYYLTLGLSYLF